MRIHPVTGRRARYVNRNFTEQIVGVSRLESDAILGMLYSHSERDDLKWRRNAIAFWDNRCTMHLAMWDYYPQKRYGHRVTVKGTKPEFMSREVSAEVLAWKCWIARPVPGGL